MRNAIAEQQQAIIRQAKRAKRTSVEDELAYQMKVADIPYVRQYKFCADRRYKADFLLYNGPSKILVECQGGSWSNGYHVRGRGYENDCRRLNVATQLGYRMLYFTSDMVHSGEAITAIEAVCKNG